MTNAQAGGSGSSRNARAGLLGTGCVAFAAAATVGVADHPPGLALLAIGVCALLLAVAHGWSVKKLVRFAGASLVGLVVGALSEVLAGTVGGQGWLSRGLTMLHGASLFFAFLLCPPGILVGLVGAMVSGALAPRSAATRSVVSLIAASTAIAVFAAFQIASPGSGRIVTIKDRAAGLNGSFEVSKSGYPANWNVHNTPIAAGKVVLSFDTEDARDGGQSLRFTVDPSYEYVRWLPAGLFQFIPADPGKSYRIAFWTKGQGSRCLLRVNSNEEIPGGGLGA